MTITFTKFGQTVEVVITGSTEEGNVEVMDPPTASRLFAESHMPAVGDVIRFDSPGGPPYIASIRVQGRDMPKTFSNGPSPTTYVFACSNGIAEYTVTAVGQDDSVTMVRGAT